MNSIKSRLGEMASSRLFRIFGSLLTAVYFLFLFSLIVAVVGAMFISKKAYDKPDVYIGFIAFLAVFGTTCGATMTSVRATPENIADSINKRTNSNFIFASLGIASILITLLGILIGLLLPNRSPKAEIGPYSVLWLFWGSSIIISLGIILSLLASGAIIRNHVLNAFYLIRNPNITSPSKPADPPSSERTQSLESQTSPPSGIDLEQEASSETLSRA
ncbi:hypothetical protein E5F05_02035 (plasmid) [Deinococcus metallilatus]|uniref:MotA/TolQ/ExbB proton channel domain-containing protein n=1 Tax=Deinococcus metallilatus TaxID=1211322 RepID=A0ABR6MVV2_9DEIO|nr:hypothetical protein [Deinococcus metallilatus]MBB5295824.1 hypothetical protein [Deinococcus metallilatus]QBY06749.1 hypothetical protein E5F05_02035 [Deinococcus metallilatus]